jgi:hypothetical protein
MVTKKKPDPKSKKEGFPHDEVNFIKSKKKKKI